MNAWTARSGVWDNTALWVPIAAGTLVQIIKFLLFWARQRRLDFRVFVRAGGMPSSHAAIVTALATTIGIQEGTGSTIFALTCVMAGIVMYDATGVRRATGRQARVLNRIVEDLYRGQPVAEERLREFLGHTPFEVIVGALLGFLIAWGWLR
ncbi:MAG: divergent PAP2 family protein [Anaerolineae bacterium]|nr:divergent PAP2 family protein [Anaerolineae bacterium]